MKQRHCNNRTVVSKKESYQQAPTKPSEPLVTLTKEASLPTLLYTR